MLKTDKIFLLKIRTEISVKRSGTEIIMTIYHLFTGGTIGSRINTDGQISPDENSPYRLLEMYKKQFTADFNIECIPVYEILSENLDAEHLLKLVRALGELLASQKLSANDGIIITHGTDTLQYTAAILGYIFSSAKIPIVLVSSDFVLDDERANGIDNYRYAVEFIKSTVKGGCFEGMSGVFVSYCNKGGAPAIHLATRLALPVEYSGDVSSVCNSYLCTFSFRDNSGSEAVYNEKSILRTDADKAFVNINPSYRILPDNRSFNLNPKTLKLTEKTDYILRIRPYPGFKYPELSEDVKAVLHESYHSGTICISDDLRAFAEKARRLNIPILLTGLDCRENEYETVEQYRKLDIIPVHNSAAIALYCKLWLAVSNGLDITEICTHSYAGDWV